MNDSSLIGKIKITGDLILKSPLLIGDGEGEIADNFHAEFFAEYPRNYFRFARKIAAASKGGEAHE